MDKTQFHERLKKLREYHGFSQKELSEKIKIPYNSIIKYETGDRKPNFDTIIDLADFYDTSIDYLMGATDYTLSQYDYDFMKDLLGLYSKKISGYINHFFKINIDKLNFDEKEYLNTDNFNMNSYIMILGILLNLALHKNSSIEDLKGDDLDYLFKKLDLICKIFFQLSEMQSLESLKIEELSSISALIDEYIKGGFSFENILNLDSLESRDLTSKKDKIKLIENYITMNNNNNQRALRLLKELLND
ncbi:helix-turn-helix domain-containing protein [Clostridium kluyveri]|uniref:helix-turn-helix domain-containing protein n=1 Tax=Clostridium kluyveri TaxID=1534 RepID=UPI0022450EF5|nr:helix-turn-helix transcriptional regulator [Clostridium kluyveri]UZQ52403.1 helix-turn-helix transcriptional regulator [Clostridium kluyveri]